MTEALAGPYCAMLLGDFGADVIKVERPGTGDQSRGWGPPFVGSESAYYLAANRNKRSITLNYDHPRGAEALQKLLASADVFIANQPSLVSLQKRGIDPDSLCAKYPRLIYCSITGYGFTGPKAGMPGYDVTSWYGLAFAAGTALPIVHKTNKAMQELLGRESVAKQILNLGALVRSSTPDELKTHIAGEIAKWKVVREKAGIEQL